MLLSGVAAIGRPVAAGLAGVIRVMGIISIRRAFIMVPPRRIASVRRVIMLRWARGWLILITGIRRIVSAIRDEELLPDVHFAGAPDAVEVGDKPGILHPVEPTDVEQGFPPLDHVIEGTISWWSSVCHVSTKQPLTC